MDVCISSLTRLHNPPEHDPLNLGSGLGHGLPSPGFHLELSDRLIGTFIDQGYYFVDSRMIIVIETED